MKIEKFGIYLADLNPRFGTEPGKIRPVVAVQTDMLNNVHPSTIVCPISSKVVREASILRVHLPKRDSRLDKDSDILVDQIRAIDNRRLLKQVSTLTPSHRQKLSENLHILIQE